MTKENKSGHLQVSDVHQIWFEEHGNPGGIPVIILHGGPGAGCSINDTAFFDLEKWKVILLDQRGAGRSKPFAELNENTTQNLVSDIEKLRNHLNITQWVVFGGSWGTALAMAYGHTYPDAIMGFIFRGVFFAGKKDEHQILYGMRDYFPESWQEMVDILTPEEKKNVSISLYERILSDEVSVSEKACYAIMKYDLNCAFLNISSEKLNEILKNKNMVIGVAKNFSHYAKNGFFLTENQLIDNLNKINHIPAIILNGRYDVITIPKSAYFLHENWENSKLIIVKKSGHSALDDQMKIALQNATKLMLEKINDKSVF